MTSTLIISNLLLWGGVLGLGMLVLSLARQLGEMQEQFSPGAPLMLASGLDVGELVPELDLETMDGGTLSTAMNGEPDHFRLYFFMKPDCPISLAMLGHVQDNHERRSDVEIVVLGSGSVTEHQALRAKRPELSHDLPWAVSDEAAKAFGVERVPYGVIANAEGIVCAHGLINTHEQLEILCEAAYLSRAEPNGGDVEADAGEGAAPESSAAS